MYVDAARVREAEARWGRPVERSFRVPTSTKEIAFIRSTQRSGRAHDVTMIVWNAPHDRFAVIAKHAYAAGAFRPPSGGLEPGESIEEGIHRETLEETGLEAAVRRYVLRARVRFEGAAPADSIDWTTHVFESVAHGETLAPRDAHEIREAAWATREELLGPLREKLLLRDSAGIRYRVALHRAIFEAIDGVPNDSPRIEA